MFGQALGALSFPPFLGDLGDPKSVFTVSTLLYGIFCIFPDIRAVYISPLGFRVSVGLLLWPAASKNIWNSRRTVSALSSLGKSLACLLVLLWATYLTTSPLGWDASPLLRTFTLHPAYKTSDCRPRMGLVGKWIFYIVAIVMSQLSRPMYLVYPPSLPRPTRLLLRAH